MGKRLYIYLIISLLCSALYMHSMAQTNKEFQFSHLTITDGLSQNNISCLFQDSKGYLWIGTRSGLNRFNGKQVEIFANDPEDSLSLSNNNIYSISEDIEQNIWVATEHGLNKFNQNTNTFERFYFEQTLTTNETDENIIYAIYFDNDGNIWAKTPSYIYAINTLTREIKQYGYAINLFSKESDKYSHPLYQDSRGTLWVGTKDGLGYFDSEADEVILYTHDSYKQTTLSHNEVRCIFEDANYNLWIGTTHGLNHFNRYTKKFTNFYYQNSHLNTINSIVEGKNGELWIATNNDGLLRFSTKNHTFTSYKHQHGENSLSSNHANCIIKDKSDILWIGTANGLNKLDIKPKKFIELQHSNATIKNSTSIFANDTNIYIGTKNNGLIVYSTRTKQSTQYTSELKNFPDSYITAIAPFTKKSILISGDSSLVVFSLTHNTYTDITNQYPQLKNVIDHKKRIRTLLTDSKQNIWIGTNAGLYKYSISDTLLTHINQLQDNNVVLQSTIINALYEDSQKNIWIGSEKGLTQYSPYTQTFKIVPYTQNLNLKNAQYKIYSIAEDAQHHIVIGTNSGLFLYNPEIEKSQFFTEKTGLPNNQIFAILEHNNTLWISTNKGLASIAQKTNLIKHYFTSDGVQGYEFTPRTAYKSPNGTMYFGGTQGVNEFHSDSITDNLIIPNIEIQKIVFYSNDIKNTLYVNDKKSVQLPWKNNTLSIHFAALEFTQPQKNTYKYTIEGLDKEWHNIENQNQINISSLPSGKYLLKIIGSNNDLVWGMERMIEINVDTPFYRTFWAYILYIIVFLIALIVFIDSRTSKLRKANKSLTEKQAATLEISKQKEELSTKNKSITDSIMYAKRIQWAIMPSKAKFKQLLPDSAILYMPKDIVSGDFYWITEIEDKIFIAAVDCTGHGVPGAFMSIIGYDLLRNITKERKIFKPSEILDYLNKALIELLTKNDMEGKDAVKDGMDMAICTFHKTKGILEFAGAINSLYIIRNNNVVTIKGDRFSVGLGNEHEDVPFKNHIIKVQQGDVFFMFTDGYADQFGWENNKKMKMPKFRHTLLSTYKLPFNKQAKALKDTLNNWKGNLEQVDDILIISFKFDNYLDQMLKRK